MFYRSFSNEIRRRFGEKLYKLSLDGGMSCPNRDGTLGHGGCIFCSGGSGEFAAAQRPSIEEQLESARARVAFKAGDSGRYIAYFQSYTNTYAPAQRLRELFMPIITRPDIAVLDIATRPDCLGDDILELLSELNRIKPVWVELGLQTIHEHTALYIRRGYELPVYEEVVKQLKARGLTVITHVILYLPGETRAHMLETVRYVGCRTDGIKLQLLHVLQGTDLAAEYAAGKFRLPEPEEYCRLIADCLRQLPPHVVIHRLTGDGAKKDLIAPLWTGDKKRVLNTLNRILEEEQVVQGAGL